MWLSKGLHFLHSGAYHISLVLRLADFTFARLSARTTEMQFLKVFSFCLMAFGIVASGGLIGSSNPIATKSDPPSARQPISVLIVDGQNNHAAWPKTTAMMKSYLEDAGKFSVEVCRTQYTWNGGELLQEFPLADDKKYQDLSQPKTDPDFNPDFSRFDVVISNFGHNAAPWPEKTKTAFVEYMKNGGGLVVVHAADNSFPDWPQYNEMIGLGGWGGRNEKSGPFVYYNQRGEEVRDTSPGGGGGHGPQHEFAVVTRNEVHPITKGLPAEFLHAKDELYERLRGPAENMTILATAYADPLQQGSGRHEPIMMAIEYGDGRIFHTTLGHADYSCACAGFITFLLRGTEWAASGNVTIELPKDYPTADRSKSRRIQGLNKQSRGAS